MKNPSFALRVVVFLVAAQLPALMITWALTLGIGLSGFADYNLSLDELAIARSDRMVIESLVKESDGRIAVEPTPALRAEMLRVPGFRFAAFDPASGASLTGSSPEVIETLKNVIGTRPVHLHFASSGRTPTDYVGHLDLQPTPFGPLQIATFGQKFLWADLFYSIKSDVPWSAFFSSGAIAFTAVIAWFAVRRGLAPLTAVVRGARGIDMNSLDQRLPLDGVPAEIKPLVESVNEALSRLDAAAARMRRYTANAAHELRTPLAIMRARLEDTEEPTFKADLLRDASQLQAIVEQMLIAARLTEHQAGIDQEVDLVTTIRQIVSDYLPLVIECNRKIDFEAEPSPVSTRGNGRAIECIVANLIDNALRAEPKDGTIVVRVGANATVEVVDHGEGIAPEDREMIFEPFWRKSDVTPGTGLGLAIAKELLTLHGGKISVEETPGGGATFKLTFPELDRIWPPHRKAQLYDGKET
jgi:signal transduction histidine kinase